MQPPDWIAHNLIHVGAVLEIICFLFRNQIMLRAVSIASSVAFAGYYFYITDRPLWEAMMWEAGSISVNVVMIFIILTEKRLPRLSTKELLLFKRLDFPSVDQFLCLLRLAKWHHPTLPLQLTEQDRIPEQLSYLMEGEAEIRKDGRTFTIQAPAFIGELAFLRGKPATATVTAMPGGVIATWSQENLHRACSRDANFRAALNVVLMRDLAEKVAVG